MPVLDSCFLQLPNISSLLHFYSSLIFHPSLLACLCLLGLIVTLEAFVWKRLKKPKKLSGVTLLWRKPLRSSSHRFMTQSGQKETHIYNLFIHNCVLQCHSLFCVMPNIFISDGKFSSNFLLSLRSVNSSRNQHIRLFKFRLKGRGFLWAAW